jgi:acyl-CoA synthetase (NDP forming)
VVEWIDPAGTVVSAGRSLRSLYELEVAPDLVILAVQGAAVLDFAAAAAAREAKALRNVPGGPAQDIETSSWLEPRLLDIVRDAGLRLVGLNSLG